MKTSYLLLFFFGCISFQLKAQSDSLLAVGYLKKAITFCESGNQDSASWYHRKVLSIYQQTGRPYDALRSYRMTYSSLKKAGRAADYIDSLKVSLSFPGRAPVNEDEFVRLSYQYIIIAFTYNKEFNNFIAAKYYYEKSFEIFSKDLKEENNQIATYLYDPLGNIYTRLGDYPRAKYFLQKNIAYGESHQIVEMQTNYSDLSIVYHEEGMIDSAIFYLKKEITHPLASPFYKGVSWSLLSDYLVENGKTAEALPYLDAAGQLLASDTVLSLKQRQHLAIDYHCSIAKYSAAIEDPAKAIDQYLAAIQLVTDDDSAIPNRDVGKWYNLISVLQLRQGKNNEALHAAQTALKYVLPAFHPADDRQLPDPATFYAENTILEALLQSAICLEKLGEDELALESYLLLPVVESRLRETYQFESASLLRLAENRAHLETGIYIARRLFEKTKNPAFAAKAFLLTEYVRNAILLENLASAGAVAHLPDSLQLQLADLQSRINWHEQEIASAKENDPARLPFLENGYFQLKQQNSELLQSIREKFPEYNHLRQSVEMTTADEISGLLGQNQAFLAYFFIEDTLHVFSKTTGAPLQWRTSPLPADFWLETESLIDYIGSEQNSFAARDKFAASAYQLYQLLLEPEVSNLPNTMGQLYIVPDDILSFIPFEILITTGIQPGTAFNEMPFLLKKFAIAYGGSATLWKLQQLLLKRPPAEKAFAGYAPVYKKESSTADISRGEESSGEQIQDDFIKTLVRDGWYDLPGAREEVRRISAVMEGDIYENEAADKSTFLRTAGQYKIIHLSMHALSDRKNPALSRFIFTPTTNVNQEFILYANELPQLHLNADLAVLSACNTGKGTLRKGEGVYSLARAFTMAGVPSVVMSLWRLPDNTTPDIMVGFYENLKTNVSKDIALQQAKLSWLEKHSGDSLLLHPFYWAGLTVTGGM